MKKKKYFVKFEFHDSSKPKIKYLHTDLKSNKSPILFSNLEELEKNLKVFCKQFNDEKIDEIYNITNDLYTNHYNKEDIKIEQFRFYGQWVTNIFSINSAPMYVYKYIIMVKI